MADREALRSANEHLAELVRNNADWLIDFAMVNPPHCHASNDLEDAVERLELRGLKLVPSSWYPCQDCVHDVYERAVSLGIPVQSAEIFGYPDGRR